MKIKALFICICISIVVAQAQVDQDKKFSDTFLQVLNDMPDHFENVKGELSPYSNDNVKRYEAKVYLTGMQNFTNDPDIIIEKNRSRYRADFGPFFSTEEVEKKKEELISDVKHVTGDKWKSEEIKGGTKFISLANPKQSVYVYQFYGDGNGIFVKIILEVLN